MVVDVQSDRTPHPVFEIEGQKLLLLPLQMAAIPLRELGYRPLRMLTETEAYAVAGALGVLFGRRSHDVEVGAA